VATDSHLKRGEVLAIKLLQTAVECRFQKFSKSVNIWPSFGKEGLLSDSPMHWCDVLLKAGTQYSCSRVVFTDREHDPSTRIVCTEHKRWRTHSPATRYLWHTATAVTAASNYAIHSERLLSSWRS